MTINPMIPNKAVNPLIAAATGPAKRSNPMIAPASKSSNPLIPTPEMPQEPSSLEAIGNVLDVPGSMARDVLNGRNPIDQLATPTLSTNRTTGRDLLNNIGVNPNDDSIGASIASFGAEVLTDPLTFTGAGVFTRGGKVLSKSGLLKGHSVEKSLADATSKTVKQILDEADDIEAAHAAFKAAGGTDDMLEHNVKHTLDFLGTDIAKPLAPAIDKAKESLLEVPGVRNLRAAFSPSVLNAVTKAGQDIGEVRKTTMDEALVDLNYRFADPIRNNDAAASKALLQDVAKQAEMSGLEMNRFKDYIDASDASKALENSQHLTRASSMAHAAHELLGTSAKADGTGVPIIDALKRLGLDTEASRKAVADWSGGRPIESLSIDKALLDDAGRFVKPYTDPEVVGGVRKAVESFNRLLKTHSTIPWIQWHTRNAISGMIQNIAMGASDLKHLPRDLVSVARLKTGKTVRGLSKDIPEFKAMGLTDAEATKMLQDEMFAHGVTTTQTAADAGKSASRLAGANKLVEAAKGPKPIAPTPLELGGKLANGIEDFNRITPYLNLRRNGWTPEMASQRVLDLQVNYSDLTHFETKYAKNIIPFWTFSSRMLPLVAKEIVQHPGGPTGQMVRAGAKSDSSSDKPNWMKGETSIPIDGKHFSGFGLMHEDATKLLGPLLKGDFPELAKQVGSRVNPLIRFPVEQATQRDIHSGRSLKAFDDASKLLGQELGPTAEHAIRSSPLARYAAEARQLQKKQENALLKFATGIRTSE